MKNRRTNHTATEAPQAGKCPFLTRETYENTSGIMIYDRSKITTKYILRLNQLTTEHERLIKTQILSSMFTFQTLSEIILEFVGFRSPEQSFHIFIIVFQRLRAIFDNVVKTFL